MPKKIISVNYPLMPRNITVMNKILCSYIGLGIRAIRDINETKPTNNIMLFFNYIKEHEWRRIWQLDHDWKLCALQ